MDDLISRQLVMKTLCERRCGDKPKGCPSGFCTESLAVDCIPSAKPAQQWIPCSERLPEVGKDVMVCYDFKGHRSVLIGVLYGDEKFHGYDDEYLTPEGRKYRKAVAWMPKPAPYKEERREE